MDLKIIGKFIAERRKAKDLTQVQLALKIGVSEKTVSKWECGYGFPDTTLMLPLCEVLDINANELLSGKLLTDEEYKNTAERNILQLKDQQQYHNKLLLTLEWVIGGMSVLFLLVMGLIASYFITVTAWRIVFIALGFVVTIVGVFFSLKIERDAGYYQCQHCNYKYIPSYKSVLWAMHMGRTRYMKCPKCNKKSWQHKTLLDD